MRIAQVAPLYESCPPRLYGGTERVVSYLTEELVRLGHEVTLFASGDSMTNARLVPVCPRALWKDPDCRDVLPYQVRLIEAVFADVSRFDLIHFHCDYLHFPMLRRCPCPSVTTLHGKLHVPDLKPLFDEYAEVPLVSISPDQRLDRAIEIARLSGHRLKVAAKIYHEERDYFRQTIEPLLEKCRSFV